MKKYCTAVVLAAGKGRRMGGTVEKQYLEIAGKPVVVYALEAFQHSGLIDEIILVADEGHLSYCREHIVDAYGLTKVSAVIAGGKERYESVWKALCTLTEAGKDDGFVLIHDGARPFLDEGIIERTYASVEQWQACVVGMPVKDSIKMVDENGTITASPARRYLWQAQTPQAFSVPLIVRAFKKQMQEDCSDITDDAMVAERQLGIRVHMVEGSYENMKITTPEDLAIAEGLVKKWKENDRK